MLHAMLTLLHYLLQILGLRDPGWVALGRQSTALPVTEIQGFLTPTEFFNDYVLPGRPVVFKGAAKQFPAYQKWDDDYFLSFEERFETIGRMDFTRISCSL